jgi:L-rhamnose mutarotase
MKIRKAFVMSVNAGAEQEYQKRHNPIWPELEKARKGRVTGEVCAHVATREFPAD